MNDPEVKVLMLKGDKGNGLSDDDMNQVKSQIESSSKVINSRIDNLILSSGSESSAEVTDARSGYDGKAYATLGAAIRSQVSELKEDLKFNVSENNENIVSSNMYDATKFNASGYYNLTGDFDTLVTDYGSTGFIKVEPNSSYCIMTSGFVTYWDSARKFISSINHLNEVHENGRVLLTPLTTPSNCKYINIAIPKDKKNTWFIIKHGDVLYDYSKISRTEKYINSIFSLDTNNLLNKNQVSSQCYNDKGKIGTVDGWGTVSIPHVTGRKYKKNWDGIVCFFSDNNMILYSNIKADTEIDAPVGTTRITFGVKLSIIDNCYIIPSGEEYKCQLKIKVPFNDFYNLKYGALGDSITYGLTATKNYGEIISNENKMQYINYGISGNRIASTSNDVNSSPMCIRYVDMNNDLDIITVMGGTNDYASQVPIGTNTSTDKTTFKGALNVLCKGLSQKYIGKRLGFITPIQREHNTGSIKLIEYVNAIKDVCAMYSIPVLDLYNDGGISTAYDKNSNGLLNDGLHPSDSGQELLARKITAFIKTL